MTELVDCDGCGYPMHYPFSVHEPEIGEQFVYCIKCEVIRFVKRIEPGDHELGELSSGTLTMRQRGKHD